MASPQPTDAHLRVAHSINEAIMLRDFTKRQRKILDLILRLSWGCGKKEAYIPRQKDFMIVGIAESHISSEIKWLQESQIIFTDGQEYKFNKDFAQWQVSRVKPFEPDKLTELVRINLNGTYRIGKNQEETYQNGKSENRKLPKTVRKNLLKQEVKTSQNSKNGNNPSPQTPLPPLTPPLKEKLKKSKERRGRGGARAGARAPSTSPNDLVKVESKESELCQEFIDKMPYYFGRQPDAREKAQARDFVKEFVLAGADKDMINEALKEAINCGKPYVSYVRKIVLSWMGVKSK